MLCDLTRRRMLTAVADAGTHKLAFQIPVGKKRRGKCFPHNPPT